MSRLTLPMIVVYVALVGVEGAYDAISQGYADSLKILRALRIARAFCIPLDPMK